MLSVFEDELNPSYFNVALVATCLGCCPFLLLRPWAEPFAAKFAAPPCALTWVGYFSGRCCTEIEVSLLMTAVLRLSLNCS